MTYQITRHSGTRKFTWAWCNTLEEAVRIANSVSIKIVGELTIVDCNTGKRFTIAQAIAQAQARKEQLGA